MNKEVYKEMCSQIYEGESWDRMINCLERKDKEIERLNKELKSLQDSYDIEEEQANYHIDLTDDLREEVDRLNNIIKEVREYIDKVIKANYEDIFNQEQKDYMIKILEILDKENK